MKLFNLLPIAIAGVVLALVIAALSVVDGIEAEERNRVQAVLSTSVLNDLRKIEAALLDAETGQRGYILTGDPQYLAPYDSGKKRFPVALADLNAHLSGSETERQRMALDRLQQLGEDKLAELAETIAFVDAGERDAALALIRSDLGQSLMREARDLVNVLEAEEQVILTAAIGSARAVQARTVRVLTFSGALILALIALLAYTFHRAERLNRTEELLEEVTRHRDRTVTLAQELSHRTKNLFGIVNSIVRMTGRSETDAQVAITKISDRISALARAHALTSTGDPDDDVPLEELIHATLEPYAAEDKSFELSGDPITIESANITPLGLILHELATNAIKYGAWSDGSDGRIEISWHRTPSEGRRDAAKITFVWRERFDQESGFSGEPMDDPAHSSSGFGSRMIETSVKQLNGTIDRRWQDGLVVEFTYER